MLREVSRFLSIFLCLVVRTLNIVLLMSIFSTIVKTNTQKEDTCGYLVPKYATNAMCLVHLLDTTCHNVIEIPFNIAVMIT